MATSDAIDAMKEAFPDLAFEARPLCRHADGRESDQRWVRVPPQRLIEVMTFLRNDPRTKFEQLSDLAGIDYLEFPDATDRFAVVYSLLSLTHNHRLWVKAFVNDPDPVLESVTGIWAGANWPEREVFDMFGTFVRPLELELGQKSLHRVGRFADISESKEYLERMEAINYTLAHDDGQTHQDAFHDVAATEQEDVPESRGEAKPASLERKACPHSQKP